jgi:very-short-patch-repair endonuclease
MNADSGRWFGECVGRCRSPIEQRFLAALLFIAKTTWRVYDEKPRIALCEKSLLVLAAQVPADRYFIDFVLSPVDGPRFAVEIDGYAFHGATPEQFAYDSERQRVITALGYRVIRFAGIEIVRDPVDKAREALSIVERPWVKIGIPEFVPRMDPPVVPTEDDWADDRVHRMNLDVNDSLERAKEWRENVRRRSSR